MKTKEKILTKALEMFNDKGIEYVGLREIAKILEMRVSNITYYFPTKDDLVYQLWIQMNAVNSELVVPNENITLYSFLEMLYDVFDNHLSYQCILLSFVHLMQRNKYIADGYSKNIEQRNEVLKSNIDAIIENGKLHDLDKSEKEALVSNLAIIIRFWISDLIVAKPLYKKELAVSIYLSNLARFFIPYATDEGKIEISTFIKQINNLS